VRDERFVDFFLADPFFAADFFLVDFFVADFFVADFFVDDFLPVDFFVADFFVVFRPPVDFFVAFFADFFGTFPPARRASESPMAIACLRLVTFLPDLPLRNVPSLRSCIAFFTLSCAFLPYFAIVVSSCGRADTTSAAKAAFDVIRLQCACQVPKRRVSRIIVKRCAQLALQHFAVTVLRQ
jgi:hypothetical protein